MSVIQHNYPRAIDFSQRDSLKQILVDSPVLTSYEVSWDTIHFLYHREPAHETPECQFKQHLISIYLKPFEARRWVNGRWCQENYQSGDISLFPADQTAPKSQCDHEDECIHLCLETPFFERVVYEAVNTNRLEIVPNFKFRDALIQQIGLELKTELESGGVESRLYAQSMATVLCVHLLRRYSTCQPIIKQYADGLPKWKLDRVLTYIQTHFDQDISLTELADLVEMSSHYFACLFKQSIGFSPHQYLIDCRIKRAKQLLREQKLSIVEICQQVGYQSQSYFTKVFRKHTGITPKKFRDSL
ncbi:AraC family transcriptional regulator [Brasilonema octagenarum UFV-E1]|uniref:AraC family transcriptional regulator n=1 Tax=Brasilonema sennae CENA114 TaxID=415709 RepID=A0A856MA47_9CYAN|nr:AraC family transcriptional regulator [Brasilonema sennae CENA114]QDL13263.1 AraC family transcriptional regulator [Brasilonema octagenarum UFV-E1]